SRRRGRLSPCRAPVGGATSPGVARRSPRLARVPSPPPPFSLPFARWRRDVLRRRAALAALGTSPVDPANFLTPVRSLAARRPQASRGSRRCTRSRPRSISAEDRTDLSGPTLDVSVHLLLADGRRRSVDGLLPCEVLAARGRVDSRTASHREVSGAACH